ncbi:MAG TPA: hypothetical protein VGP38_07780, partial [Rubrobacter sp.]|nr:hypothetical protein [Rubrobacter sp.]
MVRILFVRAGNICRLQIAWGGFESVLRREGVEDGVEVDSAGTGDWHGMWASRPTASWAWCWLSQAALDCYPLLADSSRSSR